MNIGFLTLSPPHSKPVADIENEGADDHGGGSGVPDVHPVLLP